MSAEQRDESKRQAEFDSRFAEIIAQFEDPVDDPSIRGLDEPGESEPAADDGVTNPTTSWWHPQEHEPEGDPGDPLANLPSQWRIPGPDGASFLDDEDEDFVPPPPAPLPRDDVHFWATLVTLIGGPLWMIYLALFDRYARSLWWFLAVATCVAGVVLLVMRQPKNHDDPDDDLPDDDLL